jgi:cell division protein FtsQ
LTGRDKIKKNDNILKRRRRKIIGKRIWDFLKLVLIAGFFALVVWGLNYFYNSEYFKIKSIDIQGNSHYRDEEIVEITKEMLGANIFEINKKVIESMVSEELSWVKDAELNKVFPDKVIIKINERKPYIKILYGSEYFLIDSEGVVLEKVEKENLDEYKDLILVRNAIDYSVDIGEKIAKRNVLSCAEIYRTFDIGLKGMVREARVEDNFSGDIIFVMNDGKEIIFGDNSFVEDKVKALKQFLKEETVCNIIDLRSPGNPVLK